MSALVADGAGAELPQLVPAPYVAMSTTTVPEGQAGVNAVVVWASTTLPLVAPMLAVPTASGVGRSTVPPRPRPP